MITQRRPVAYTPQRIALVALLTAMVLLLASCETDDGAWEDDAPLEQEAVQAETENLDEEDAEYDDSDDPEDCLDDEAYDEEDQLCYPVVYCDEAGNCEEDDYGFLDALYGMVDELVWGLVGEDFEDAAEMEEHTLITYRISGNQIVEPDRAAVTDDLLDLQDDADTHQKIWVYFSQLVPPEQRTYLSRYVIFTDGPEEVLAFVTPDTDDPTQWRLGVDIADSSNPEDLTFTLVHEFGHLLTLNDRQVPADRALALEPDNEALYEETMAACPVYFPGEGCSEPDSYINAFFQRFWADSYETWQATTQLEDEVEREDATEAFYLSRRDAFVSDYAATSPEEDIAETFATFVLRPKPTGDRVADQKVRFLYDYPELVKLRAEMSGRLYSRLRRR